MALLGGTFDGLHAGHARLLEAAFEAAETVGVGLTTSRFLREHPKPLGRRIASEAVRRRRLMAYLARHWPDRAWWVVPLDDEWGRSVEPGADVLVASEETRAGAERVNAERERRGLAPLELRLIPVVRAEDGLALSARRIRAGEVDVEGHRLRPLRIGIAVPGPYRESVERAARRRWPTLRFLWRMRSAPRRASGGGEARNVLLAAQRAGDGLDYGIAVQVPATSGALGVVWAGVSTADGAVRGGWHRSGRSTGPDVVGVAGLIGQLLSRAPPGSEGARSTRGGPRRPVARKVHPARDP